ncbi:hypothetical protein [Cohnella rhizosphaerae]|uniref:ABC-2 family transporter protein n=1 Tax=Cohnella rhizosphaerae TaxID=1457232 RepID=A0A9X4KRX3_9BACL|nr:hypothetical protein [Cohnella rhizosphaerae]MDG0809790.1 hypothetical protein [Cohnella rhizosphaerae]
MSGWRATKALAAFEFKRDRLGLVLTAAFALYVGTIISALIDDRFGDGDVSRYLSGMADWLYTFTIPAFGCAMNRTMFAYWRGDVFTKRLSHWRTMPIPLERMASARMLLAAVAMAAIGTIFFVSQYLLAPALRDRVSPGEWAGTAVVWLCYGLIVNALILYLEMGFSGKTYVKAYMSICLLLGLIALAAAWRRISLVGEVTAAVGQAPVLLPVGAGILAIAVLYGMRRAIVKRMARRSYTF